MTPFERCSISIEDTQDVVSFSVSFHRKDARVIKRTIQTLFRDKFTVERIAGDVARITIVSGKLHDPDDVRALYHCFHHVAAVAGL